MGKKTVEGMLSDVLNTHLNPFHGPLAAGNPEKSLCYLRSESWGLLSSGSQMANSMYKSNEVSSEAVPN